MTVLQGNMNGSAIADDLLWQVIAEWDVDIALINEPYRGNVSPAWMTNHANTTAIWITKRRGLSGHKARRYYVWMTADNVTYVNVYPSPYLRMREFIDRTEALEDALGDTHGDLIVTGDMPYTNSQGMILLNMAARLGLTVMNDGCLSTEDEGLETRYQT